MSNDGPRFLWPFPGGSARFAARVLALVLGVAVCGVPALAQDASRECTNVDGTQFPVAAKTISIHNNSGVTIYPALQTSANAVNEWLQACFRSTDAMPTTFVTKLYVNQGTGIPAGASVDITLPLYSDLGTKDDRGNEQYITWWNGGRVMLADRDTRMVDPTDKDLDLPPEVKCTGTTACTLTVRTGNSQLPVNVYAQLNEYTFGDSDVMDDGKRVLRPANVGYNISYVDHVYLPVAIAPKNNPYIGYSGSVEPLATFRQKLTEFLAPGAPGEGWPVYNLDPGAGKDQVKLPGGYNVFAERDGTVDWKDDMPVEFNGPDHAGLAPVLTVYKCLAGDCSGAEQDTLRFGKAVQDMQNMWGSCVDWGDEDLRPWVTDRAVVCPGDLKADLGVIQGFYAQNHKNYLKAFPGSGCTGNAPPPDQATFGYWNAINHIYGWVPYNGNCGAGVNALSTTAIPGWNHARAQQMYIHELQYRADGRFNPYVRLIHDDLKLSAYAFSVDDAVGFMTEMGDGLTITVGGPDGLDNKQAFSFKDGFQVIVGTPAEFNGKVTKPLLKSYGVCVIGAAHNPCADVVQNMVLPTTVQIAGFRVGTVAEYPIRVAFTDVDDNVYTFDVPHAFAQCAVDAPPGTTCPPDRTAFRAAIIPTCKVVKGDGTEHPRSHQWCNDTLNPNQSVTDRQVRSYLSWGQLANYLP